MELPKPYIKTFMTPCGVEAEVWIDVPTEPYPVSVHTTKEATRETTAERRAQQWIDSDEGKEEIGVELALLGVI